MKGAHWTYRIRGLLHFIASEPKDGLRPLTFFIGAGASLSSGGPLTSDVEDALLEENPDRFPDRDTLYAHVHDVSMERKRRSIRHRFEFMRPYIGYLCLARLGQRRQVVVVSLNWDMMVERACDMLGVPCHRFDFPGAGS